MDLLARPDKNHLFGNHCDMSVTTPLSRYLEMGSNAGFGCDFMLFKKHHSYEVNARCSSRISNSLLRFRFRDTFKRSLVSPLHQLKNSIPGDGTKIVLPVTPGLKLGILILSHRLTRFYRYVSVELKFKERKKKDFFSIVDSFQFVTCVINSKVVLFSLYFQLSMLSMKIHISVSYLV